MRDFIAPYDHSVVARLRDAGFVIVGTTKLPEFGILPVTEPQLHGPARNPWDPARTPGGSSGGAAAAVAAGMVPLAHGNDGGGSLRIPAACCGLVGLKAQRHRVSTAPDLGASQLVIDGVLTRTVAETAELLDILAGYVTGDAAWIPAPAEPFARTAARRAGRPADRVHDDAADPGRSGRPGLRRGGRRAAALAETLGHDVEQFEPPWQTRRRVQASSTTSARRSRSASASRRSTPGRAGAAPDDVEPMSWAIWERARQFDAVAFQLLQTQLQARMRPLVAGARALRRADHPGARRSGRCRSARSTPRAGLETFRRSGYFTPFTAIFNLSGQPASRCRCSTAPTACRSASSSSGARPAKGRCWRSRRRSRRRRRRATARPPVS